MTDVQYNVHTLALLALDVYNLQLVLRKKPFILSREVYVSVSMYVTKSAQIAYNTQ